MSYPLWLTLAFLLATCQPAADTPPPADPSAPTAATATTAQPTAAPPDDGPSYFEISTSMGRMVIRLYDETPRHRDNFRKLVASGFYDGTTFHRVIEGYMIQGGDPNSKDDEPRNDGLGGPGYTIPPEFNPAFFHKRGALSTARMGDQVNPQRASSGSQFFIVQGGRPYDHNMLDQLENRLRQEIPSPNFKYADAARAAYTQGGGAPQLDQMYTVFGELVEGFDVLDRIAAAETPQKTGQQDWRRPPDAPYEKITMTIRALPKYGE